MISRLCRTLCPAVLAAAVLASLAGCFSPRGDINVGFPPARPVAANLPPGPEHDICRQELGNAIARIDKLQHDLDGCKADKRKVEAERDRFKGERDYYKKQIGQ